MPFKDTTLPAYNRTWVEQLYFRWFGPEGQWLSDLLLLHVALHSSEIEGHTMRGTTPVSIS